ncbi:unnamed protein product [Adineta steineri]|uniref:Uncharacterized protein n=1 Tax=Adineta steineri TaxID=433720 RepID=A0A813RG87_9BILA|nr:unnamed protein product [Adineta steineri]CAF1072320.1 unnamed protein product [Adineta steineri]
MFSEFKDEHSGKTTTFRILISDETAIQGTTYIDGQNVNFRLRPLCIIFLFFHNERVCNRIMFNSQLACLGTIQHLKTKFGQGYTIENVDAFLLTQTQSILIFQIEKSISTELFEIV